MRSEVFYWKVDNPQHYSTDSFPVFYHATEPGDCSQPIYGTSIYEFPELLKVYSCLMCRVPTKTIECIHRHKLCGRIVPVYDMHD